MSDQRDWPGADRRHPGAAHACRYTLQRIRDEVVAFAAKVPEQAAVLDFGCGEKPYEVYFDGRVKEYVGLDIADSPEHNEGVNRTIAQGDRIPFDDGHFDAILSTQVFEHIRDPLFYGAEFFRVLRPGGIALVSSAFAWEYHPYPSDYWRITEDGYRLIFTDFAGIDFDVDTNSLQTSLQSFNFVLERRGVKMKLPYRVINRLVARVDRQKGDRNLPANIFVHLKKQGA